MRVFVDTNLWAYPFDRRVPAKGKFAAEWLRTLASEHEIVISSQVMIELRSVLTSKVRPALSADDVRAALTALAVFEVVGANANLVLDAHALAGTARLAWFDALIVEAALRSHCDVLYSEDFSHGQRLGGHLLVQNPFRPQ